MTTAPATVTVGADSFSGWVAVMHASFTKVGIWLWSKARECTSAVTKDFVTNIVALALATIIGTFIFGRYQLAAEREVNTNNFIVITNQRVFIQKMRDSLVTNLIKLDNSASRMTSLEAQNLLLTDQLNGTTEKLARRTSLDAMFKDPLMSWRETSCLLSALIKLKEGIVQFRAMDVSAAEFSLQGLALMRSGVLEIIRAQAINRQIAAGLYNVRVFVKEAGPLKRGWNRVTGGRIETAFNANEKLRSDEANENTRNLSKELALELENVGTSFTSAEALIKRGIEHPDSIDFNETIRVLDAAISTLKRIHTLETSLNI